MLLIWNAVDYWSGLLDAPEIGATGAMVVHGGVGPEKRRRCERVTLRAGGRIQRPGGRTPVRFGHWVHEHLAWARGAPQSCNRPIPSDLERRAFARLRKGQGIWIPGNTVGGLHFCSVRRARAQTVSGKSLEEFRGVSFWTDGSRRRFGECALWAQPSTPWVPGPRSVCSTDVEYFGPSKSLARTTTGKHGHHRSRTHEDSGARRSQIRARARPPQRAPERG